MFRLFLTLLVAVGISAHNGEVHDDSEVASTIEWDVIAPLPSARSDLTATVAGADSMIYLIGGCDSNQRKGEDGYFYCPSITDLCNVYDPKLDSYGTCASAPGARYRHAAVEINNKVWLVGGINDQNEAYKNIDVYDPATNTWSVYDSWDGATADLAAFALGTDLYLVGGYDIQTIVSDEYYTGPSYEAMSHVFKIDTTAESLTIEEADSLEHGRGDIFAAVTDDGHVYVTGGFTHLDYWCAPMDTVERFNGSKWETLEASTHYARGDKALVHMNSFIYAVGGETKEECQDSVPIEHVEVYDIATGKWVEDTVIPEETFRFVAVGHEPTDAIYIFGGQHHLESCQDTPEGETYECYPVATDAIMFVDKEWATEVFGAAGSAGVSVFTTVFVAVAVFFTMQ